jgi:toxin ParE1/3/4
VSKPLIVLPQADRDTDEASVFLAERDQERALRFLDAASETYRLIAESPGVGSVYPFRSPHVQDIRRRFVRGFREYLIFYRETDDAVVVLRVLHGSRDLTALLGDTTDLDSS